jgi:predicted Co/Zn/Cd cation transporter (cation efflux family)
MLCLFQEAAVVFFAACFLVRLGSNTLQRVNAVLSAEPAVMAATLLRLWTAPRCVVLVAMNVKEFLSCVPMELMSAMESVANKAVLLWIVSHLLTANISTQPLM